jgi:hypothetical protein
MARNVRLQVKAGEVKLEGDAFQVLLGASWGMTLVHLLVRFLTWRSRRRRQRHAYRSLRRHL